MVHSNTRPNQHWLKWTIATRDCNGLTLSIVSNYNVTANYILHRKLRWLLFLFVGCACFLKNAHYLNKMHYYETRERKRERKKDSRKTFIRMVYFFVLLLQIFCVFFCFPFRVHFNFFCFGIEHLVMRHGYSFVVQ